MKVVLIGLTTLALAACQGNLPNQPQRTTSDSASAEADVELSPVRAQEPEADYFTEEQINSQITSAPIAVPMAETETVEMSQTVSQMFFESQGITGNSMSAAQAEEGEKLVMDLIDASESGNVFRVMGAANRLAKFSDDLKPDAAGLVDVAGIMDAIQDIIDAAMDADVAGIIAAVQDLIDAILN
ncbi:hypothetical protein [Pseudobacteriovorax antillogorgiicola]|nr:hypothetical protein [Pseudobacteriovorax antillogorgiicola]